MLGPKDFFLGGVTDWAQESKSEAPAPSEPSSDAGRVKTVDARHAKWSAYLLWAILKAADAYPIYHDPRKNLCGTM